MEHDRCELTLQDGIFVRRPHQPSRKGSFGECQSIVPGVRLYVLAICFGAEINPITLSHLRGRAGGHENLCNHPLFTGYTRDGDFATALADLRAGRFELFDAIEFDPLIAAGDVLYDLAFLLMRHRRSSNVHQKARGAFCRGRRHKRARSPQTHRLLRAAFRFRRRQRVSSARRPSARLRRRASARRAAPTSARAATSRFRRGRRQL
jgi:hypothetical protein